MERRLLIEITHRGWYTAAPMDPLPVGRLIWNVGEKVSLLTK